MIAINILAKCLSKFIAGFTKMHKGHEFSISLEEFNACNLQVVYARIKMGGGDLDPFGKSISC